MNGPKSAHLELLEEAEVGEAMSRIDSHIRETPLLYVRDFFLKCENQQRTGSFKIRGALNKVFALSRDALGRGVVCASAGNHGQGVALAAALREARCTVIVPADAPAVKRQAIAAYGAELLTVEGGYGEAEQAGLELADGSGAVWISPYNDRQVIAGQATLGLELAAQMNEAGIPPDARVYVPVSGGGLVCGVGLALKWRRAGSHVIGVQTAAAAYMYAHFNHDVFEPAEERPTLADGLAGPVEAGSVTFKWLDKAVDEMQVVSEEEIEAAMCWLLERGLTVEPSAAVPLAAARRAASGSARVVVLSGGNVDRSRLGALREICTG